MRKYLISLAVLLACAPGQDLPETSLERSSLESAFTLAAGEYAVPEAVLKAIAWNESRFSPEAGLASDGGCGLTHLAGERLARASRLTGRPEADLCGNAVDNLLGGAALLREEADRIFADRADLNPLDLSDWYPVVLAYPGLLDPQLADLYAGSVFGSIARGERRSLDDGWVVLDPQPVDTLRHSLFGTLRSSLQPDYPTASWSASPNFTAGHGAYDYVVVHVAQNSYANALAEYKNAASGKSVHYLVRSNDGLVTQLVEEKDTAKHSCPDYDARSISIGHEGYVADAQWFTDAMYRSSANLARFVADAHGIAKDRQHIIGHSEVAAACSPGADPGSHWDWAKYMNLVTGCPAGMGWYKGVVYQVNPANASDTTNRVAGAQVSVSPGGAAMLSDATGNFKFCLPPGQYTVTAKKAGFGEGTSSRTVAADGEVWGSIGLEPACPAANGWYKGVVYEVNPADPNDKTKRVAAAEVALSTGAKATSDAAGNFKFCVPAGHYTATAKKAGYQDGASAGDVVAGADTWASIGMTPVAACPAGNGWYKGVVYEVNPANASDKSKVLAGAEVSLGTQKVTTDATGLFAFCAAPGSHTATARKQGYLDATSTGTVVANQEIQAPIGMTPGCAAGNGWYKGVVYEVNAANPSDKSKVLSGAEVTLMPGSVKLTTAAAGTFAFCVAPGAYTATAKKQGYQDGTSSGTVVANQEIQAPIGLVSGCAATQGWYKGVVFKVNPTDPKDMTARVEGAEVTLAPGGHKLTTDATGSFAFCVAPGSYTATAIKAGYEDGTSSRTVEAGKEAWGSIGMSAACPAGSGWYKGVVYENNPADPNDKTKRIDAAEVTIAPTSAKVVTDSAGNFKFCVPAGDYTATARKTGYQDGTSARTVVAAAEVWGSIGLNKVLANDTEKPAVAITSPKNGAVVDAASVKVVGTVTDNSGPIAKVYLTLNGGTASEHAVVNGAFEATITLTRGKNTVDVSAKDPSNNVGTASIEVTFATGLSGYVHHAEDESIRLSGATVELLSASGSSVASAVSQPDGSFRLDAAPGSYTLRASLPDFEPATKPVTVKADKRVQEKIGLAPRADSGPTVLITSPANGAKVGSSPVTVKGVAQGFVPTTITVAGKAVEFDGDGAFSAQVELVEGTNLIEVAATGTKGEQVTASVEVTFQPGADGTADEEGGGCGCGSSGNPLAILALALPLPLLRRRRLAA